MKALLVKNKRCIEFVTLKTLKQILTRNKSESVGGVTRTEEL